MKGSASEVTQAVGRVQFLVSVGPRASVSSLPSEITCSSLSHAVPQPNCLLPQSKQKKEEKIGTTVPLSNPHIPVIMNIHPLCRILLAGDKPQAIPHSKGDNYTRVQKPGRGFWGSQHAQYALCLPIIDAPTTWKIPSPLLRPPRASALYNICSKSIISSSESGPNILLRYISSQSGKNLSHWQKIICSAHLQICVSLDFVHHSSLSLDSHKHVTYSLQKSYSGKIRLKLTSTESSDQRCGQISPNGSVQRWGDSPAQCGDGGTFVMDERGMGREEGVHSEGGLEGIWTSYLSFTSFSYLIDACGCCFRTNPPDPNERGPLLCYNLEQVCTHTSWIRSFKCMCPSPTPDILNKNLC